MPQVHQYPAATDTDDAVLLGSQDGTTKTFPATLLGSPITHTGGLFASRPSAGTVTNGSTYYATDVNGGTLYTHQSGAWAQAAPGVTEASGFELARTEITSTPSGVSSTTLTDVSSLSINFATGSRPALIRLVCPQCSNNTAGSGGRIAIANSAGTVLSDAVGDSPTANGILQISVEARIPASTAAETYKVQIAHRTSGTFTLGALAFRIISLYAVTI